MRPPVPRTLDEHVVGAQRALGVGTVQAVEHVHGLAGDGNRGDGDDLGGGRVFGRPGRERGSGEKLALRALPRPVRGRGVERALFLLEDRLALGDVILLGGEGSVLQADRRVVIAPAGVIVRALAVRKNKVQHLRLRVDVNRIRDPPVAAAAVEPVLYPRRMIVRQGLHANLPRLTLPAVVSHVHVALPAVAESVFLVAAVVDDGVVPGLRVGAQPVVDLVHV
mmetsp:Transcript_6569/g.27313  ORF Transcript_6569/g.27313 Transcript_6569/m.27313 type:complete len:223 (+) Transcript_6569:1747-2415(+)